MKATATFLVAIALMAVTSLVYSSVGDLPDLPDVQPMGEAPDGIKGRTLKAFGTEAELRAFFKRMQDRAKREQRSPSGASANTAADSLAASPAQAEAKAAKEDDSVTNNQHAGVDEGGIVKVHGEHLVILRRGRLFTVRIGGDSLSAVSAVDAYAPDVDPRNDWYDEMLVAGDTVVVIGYSYGRGGTEINLFDITASGRVTYRSTYHLRSNDYYSSRNYASRLMDNKLIFYTPSYLGYHDDPFAQFPAIRRWQKGYVKDDFRPITTPTRIYRAESLESSSYSTALHTVTVCDLANRGFDCKATAVLGAPGRVFYVSPGSVYVWTTDWHYRNLRAKATSMLYRMPLDGSAPSALGVSGGPVDQFSFLESSDGHLNVLVRAEGHGEQMWGSEIAAGEVALLRTPIDRFSDGSESAPNHLYSELPTPRGYTFHNRFVGDHVLYGTGSGWGRPQSGNGELYAIKWTNGEATRLELGHGVDRIEQMGSDAVVVGANGADLHFTPVKLGRDPDTRSSYIRRNAAQGETRSHGFFYKPTGRDSGLLGLPIARAGRRGYRHLVEGSAAVLFIRNDRRDFEEIGELGSDLRNANDGCKASCVDWYGNARPLFIRDRIFAMLGYEIVEGELNGRRIVERRRANFAPSRLRAGIAE